MALLEFKVFDSKEYQVITRYYYKMVRLYYTKYQSIYTSNGEGKVTQCIVRGCSRSYGNSLSEDKSTRRNAIREQFYREQRQIQDLSARLSKGILSSLDN